MLKLLGTVSVTEAFNAFSVEVVVAAKTGPSNDEFLDNLGEFSQFLAPF
jgi:hypothetical protein